ncbi:acyltransferase family protein [Phocaeicola sp.]
MKVRYEFVDIMKGFCILLVMADHINVPGLTEYSLSYFRMPLYYMLSGLFFSQYDSFKTFLTKKTNNLIIPYFFFSLFTYIIAFSFIIKNGQFNYHAIFEKPLPIPNAPIWFLLSLYSTSLLFYTLSFIKSPYYKFLLALFISWVGYSLGKHSIHLPLFIDTSLSALFFYQFGSYLNATGILNDSKKLWTKFILYTTSFLIISHLLMPAKDLELVLNIIPFSFVYYILAGTIGTLSILYLSKVIGRTTIIPIKHIIRPIKYLGKYSIIILGTHWIYMKFLAFYVIPHIKAQLDGKDLWIFFAIILLLSFPTIYLMKTYLPWFCAQKPLIKTNKKL